MFYSSRHLLFKSLISTGLVKMGKPSSYPLTLNPTATTWSPGVEPGGKITAEHDAALIACLI